MNAIEQVCEMFDCVVLSDLESDPDAQPPICVYAIGCHTEWSAGLRGFVMSPWFYSHDLLEDWCVRNLDALGQCEIAPDATNWQ